MLCYMLLFIDENETVGKSRLICSKQGVEDVNDFAKSINILLHFRLPKVVF